MKKGDIVQHRWWGGGDPYSGWDAWLGVIHTVEGDRCGVIWMVPTPNSSIDYSTADYLSLYCPDNEV